MDLAAARNVMEGRKNSLPLPGIEAQSNAVSSAGILRHYTDRAVRVRKLVVRDTECGSEYNYGMSAAFASVVKI